MRRGDVADAYASPSPSKGQYRRRRLYRGVDCWALDVTLCQTRPRRIAYLTFTMDVDDQLAAQGLMRRFWALVRGRWLGTQYFAWLELQANGRVHYQAIWLDPPHRQRVDLLRWVARAWGHGRTQVRFRSPQGGLRAAIDYAKGYAKKMGKKSYQQRYDSVSPTLRTFMTNRLEIPPRELAKHLDRDEWVYRGQASAADLAALGLPNRMRSAPGTPLLPVLEKVGHLEHVVPFAGRCSALDHRRGRFRHLPTSWSRPLRR